MNENSYIVNGVVGGRLYLTAIFENDNFIGIVQNSNFEQKINYKHITEFIIGVRNFLQGRGIVVGMPDDMDFLFENIIVKEANESNVDGLAIEMDI